jgi:hypothetical protein
LVEELQAFEYQITASGNYTANAASGLHDDLITCLGLATMLEGSVTPRYKRDLYAPPRPGSQHGRLGACITPTGDKLGSC